MLDDALGGSIAEATAAVDAAGRRPRSLSALSLLADTEFHLERYHDALHHYDLALRRASGKRAVTVLLGRCRTRVTLGDLAGADADACEAARLSGDDRVDEHADNRADNRADDRAVHALLTLRALTALWRHGPAAAQEAAEQGRRRSAGHRTALIVLAHVRFAQRRHACALELLQGEPEPWRQANWFSGVAESLAASGDLDAAMAWADRAAAAARATGLGGQAARAALAGATVRLEAGELTEALALALESADAFSARGRRLWTGQAYLVAAQACAWLGEEVAAQAFVGRVRSIADAAGSAWLGRLVSDGLRRAGARAVRRATADLRPFALTPREEQIAWLAARGFSSAQIGAQLFISRRTVETHLIRVFRKLGISSRSALGLRLSGR